MAKAYPEQKKADVIALALSGELTKAQVAERAGISSTTLFRWIKDAQPKRANVSHLRAVPDAKQEPAPPARRPTVSEAAETGTTRELLVATRTRIARAVEDPNTPARDLAALTKRLFEVVRDIEAIDARDEEAGATGDVPDAKFDASAI
jgi:transposase-like protein